MATEFSSAITLLAPYVDNGVDKDNPRVKQRVNEAQRRLIDHYNFLCRREEFQQDLLVYVEDGKGDKLILDNIDATKVMILSLWREENNELEMSNTLEKKALDMVERDILQSVEAKRRDDYVTLEKGLYNTLGSLVGRLGLEIIPRYRIAPNRLRSYVRSSYRMAVDHYNYVVRRESLDRPTITKNELDDDNSTLEISPEIIREIVINQITQDNA